MSLSRRLLVGQLCSAAAVGTFLCLGLGPTSLVVAAAAEPFVEVIATAATTTNSSSLSSSSSACDLEVPGVACITANSRGFINFCRTAEDSVSGTVTSAAMVSAITRVTSPIGSNFRCVSIRATYIAEFRVAAGFVDYLTRGPTLRLTRREDDNVPSVRTVRLTASSQCTSSFAGLCAPAPDAASTDSGGQSKCRNRSGQRITAQVLSLQLPPTFAVRSEGDAIAVRRNNSVMLDVWLFSSSGTVSFGGSFWQVSPGTAVVLPSFGLNDTAAAQMGLSDSLTAASDSLSYSSSGADVISPYEFSRPLEPSQVFSLDFEVRPFGADPLELSISTPPGSSVNAGKVLSASTRPVPTDSTTELVDVASGFVRVLRSFVTLRSESDANVTMKRRALSVDTRMRGDLRVLSLVHPLTPVASPVDALVSAFLVPPLTEEEVEALSSRFSAGNAAFSRLSLFASHIIAVLAFAFGVASF